LSLRFRILLAMEIDLSTLCRELNLDWSAHRLTALEAELAPYLRRLRGHLSSGDILPSHIEGSGCLQAPIGEDCDPEEMFRRATEAGAGVGSKEFTVHEYSEYWVTVHPSDSDRVPTIPVVMMLLKRPPCRLPELERLRDAATAEVGARVGGCSFLAFNLPGFHWDLHTDDEYEAVSSRVHVPIDTTPENLFVWARDRKSTWGDWLLARYLERGKVYQVRTDVPHTVVNNHPSDGRLHLIMDVEGPFRPVLASS
jgi:hypothetical protein